MIKGNHIDTLYLKGEEYNVSPDINVECMSPHECDSWAKNWLIENGITPLDSVYVNFTNTLHGVRIMRIMNYKYKKAVYAPLIRRQARSLK